MLGSRRHRCSTWVVALVAGAIVASACSPNFDGSSASTSVDDTVTEPNRAPERAGSTDSTTAPADIATSADAATSAESVAPAGTAAPTTDAPASSAAAEYEPEPIEWREFDDDIDTATLQVPVAYDDPDGPRFELLIARHRALDPDARIGTLLFNPGGPGRAGFDFVINAAQQFGRELLERFDIVGWDPRGTGASTPAIDCIDDYDRYYAADSTPETDGERAEIVGLAEEFYDGCAERSGPFLAHVGTTASARDIDSIRRALGEEEISFLGFSYGSELGSTWATLFPDTVRAAVFDGGSDPDADSLEYTTQQLRGFEAALDTFLSACLGDRFCTFDHGGDAQAAYVELLESLDDDPLVVDSERAPVNRDVATTATLRALYSDGYWPALDRALTSAQVGDGSGLLELYDGYYQRRADGSYSNYLEAFQAISCADTADRSSVEEADAQVTQLHVAAPSLVPADSTGSYFCTFFPEAVEPRIPITGEGAGPLVVIGTTGDAATPFESTVALADALEDGRLVIVEADHHTGYGLNSCVNDVVHRYLVDLEVPEDGTNCG